MLPIVVTAKLTSFAGDAPPRRVPLIVNTSSTSYNVPPELIATDDTLPDPSITTSNVAPVPSIVVVDATAVNVFDAVYAPLLDVTVPIPVIVQCSFPKWQLLRILPF